jgi:fumarate reductase subunit D
MLSRQATGLFLLLQGFESLTLLGLLRGPGLKRSLLHLWVLVLIVLVPWSLLERAWLAGLTGLPIRSLQGPCMLNCCLSLKLWRGLVRMGHSIHSLLRVLEWLIDFFAGLFWL